MRFEKWEQEAYDYLSDLYNNFFEELSKRSMKCFRIDAKELFSSKVKELTQKQKKEIYDFWKKYTDDFQIDYTNYYIDRTGKYDKRFIPDDLFVGYIDGYLNNRALEPGVADKNYFDLYLKGFKLPKTYVHLINGLYEDNNYNIISEEQAIDILAKQDEFIVKPSTASYGGKGIEIIKNCTKKNIKDYIDKNENDNLIFQEVINQSEDTSKIHPKSLNTIRIMTLILDNEVKVLHHAFRMGVGNSCVDNASFGGIYCRINDDGTLSDIAYDALGNKFEKHPDGMNFSEIKIPSLDNIKKLVKEATQRFPHFRLIGWDIALNKENEPVIIEANLTMSGMDVIETICGPLFGKYTEEVLDEVFLKEHKAKTGMDISQYV